MQKNNIKQPFKPMNNYQTPTKPSNKPSNKRFPRTPPQKKKKRQTPVRAAADAAAETMWRRWFTTWSLPWGRSTTLRWGGGEEHKTFCFFGANGFCRVSCVGFLGVSVGFSRCFWDLKTDVEKKGVLPNNFGCLGGKTNVFFFFLGGDFDIFFSIFFGFFFMFLGLANFGRFFRS